MTGFLSPALVLGAVLATAYGAVFHLWQKGNAWLLRRRLVAAWLGFACGHLVGSALGVDWLTIGRLNVLTGTAGALAALLIARLSEG